MVLCAVANANVCRGETSYDLRADVGAKWRIVFNRARFTLSVVISAVPSRCAGYAGEILCAWAGPAETGPWAAIGL